MNREGWKDMAAAAWMIAVLAAFVVLVVLPKLTGKF